MFCIGVCVTVNNFDTKYFIFTANAYRLSVPLITNNLYRPRKNHIGRPLVAT